MTARIIEEDQPRFTPGPWVAQQPEYSGPDYGVTIIGARRGDDGSILETPTNGLVAASLPLPVEIDSMDYTRVIANANLISAAPDMYDALEALNAGARPANWQDADDGEADAWRQLDSALAKARGQ